MIYMAQSPCSFLPLADSPCSLFYPPFTYLESLFGVIGSCPLWSQVADKLSPQLVPQVNGGRGVLRVEGGQSLLLLGSQGTYLYTPIPFALYIKPSYHFNGSNGTAYTRPSKRQHNSLSRSLYLVTGLCPFNYGL
jgi:hypothetical protein